MPYDPKRHHRHSIRWTGRDYAQVGVYFVTICTRGHQYLFGQVVGDAVQLSAAGRVVEECWRQIPLHFPHVALDEFIVMPNHVHGILMIVDPDNCPRAADPDPNPSVGANHHSPNLPAKDGPLDGVNVPCTCTNQDSLASDAHQRPNVRANDYSPLRVRGTSRTIGSVIRGFKTGVTKWMRKNANVRDVWQRNYFEHVIRNEESLHHIRRYITQNPASWLHDPENPQAPRQNPNDRRGE